MRAGDGFRSALFIVLGVQIGLLWLILQAVK